LFNWIFKKKRSRENSKDTEKEKENGHKAYPQGPNVEGVSGGQGIQEGNCVFLDYSSKKR